MKIITDTGALLSPKEGEKIGVDVLPLNVIADKKSYKEYVDDSSYEDPSNIDTIEVWDINAVTLSGYVMAFGDFGETSVDWIEEGLRGVSAAQALALK